MRNAYLSTLYEIAQNDSRVYALISDNGAIVYDKYRADLPKQYLNLGISEANMIGVASGMASKGKIPFAYTIGSFLAYRAYEFIRNDVCLQNLNVKIVGTGSGERYSSLGPTHHTTEDLAGLRALPNLTLICPASPMEVAKATRAAYEIEGPVYLRLGTNREPEIYDEDYDFVVGKAVSVREGTDVAIISTGTMVSQAIEIADELLSEDVRCEVLNIHTIRPIDREAIERLVDKCGKVVTIEDHTIYGGLGTAVAEVIADYGRPVVFKRVGLTDFSHGYGTYEEVKDANGIGKEKFKKEILKIVEG